MSVNADGEIFRVEGTATLTTDNGEPNNPQAEGTVAMEVEVIHQPIDNPDGRIGLVAEEKALPEAPSASEPKTAPAQAGGPATDPAAKFMGDAVGEAGKKILGF